MKEYTAKITWRRRGSILVAVAVDESDQPVRHGQRECAVCRQRFDVGLGMGMKRFCSTPCRKIARSRTQQQYRDRTRAA